MTFLTLHNPTTDKAFEMSSSSDRDNLAKRRRIHKEESPTPPVSHFSERSGPNDNLTAGTSHEEGGCDDTKSEREDTGYDESSEPFPDCPAFDPAVQRVNGRVEEVTKKLSSILEQYSSINRHTPTHLTLQRIDAGSASLHFLPQSILLIPSERLFLQFTPNDAQGPLVSLDRGFVGMIIADTLAFAH